MVFLLAFSTSKCDFLSQSLKKSLFKRRLHSFTDPFHGIYPFRLIIVAVRKFVFVKHGDQLVQSQSHSSRNQNGRQVEDLTSKRSHDCQTGGDEKRGKSHLFQSSKRGLTVPAGGCVTIVLVKANLWVDRWHGWIIFVRNAPASKLGHPSSEEDDTLVRFNRKDGLIVVVTFTGAIFAATVANIIDECCVLSGLGHETLLLV